MTKISIYKNELINALDNVVSATKISKSNKGLEVLSHVLCTVKDGNFTLYSTNCELELTSQITCIDMLCDDAVFLLPANKFRDIIKSMPNDSVIEISPNFKEEFKHQIKCVGQRSKYTLLGLDPTVMPNSDDSNKELVGQVDVGASELHYALMSIINFTASTDVRTYLNGVNFKLNQNQLTLCATDGHRLSVFNVNAECGSYQDESSLILPRIAVTELIKCLAKTKDSVSLQFLDNKLKFKTNDYSFSSLLIDGRYPDVNRVIPKNENFITVNSNDLINAVTRSAILIDSSNKVGLFNFSANEITIDANENGESSVEKVDVLSQLGDEVSNIGFNLNYLSTAIKSIDRDLVKIAFKDSNSSILISADDKSSQIAVIMPSKI